MVQENGGACKIWALRFIWCVEMEGHVGCSPNAASHLRAALGAGRPMQGCSVKTLACQTEGIWQSTLNMLVLVVA